MDEVFSVEIKYNPRGYYTLYVNGKFGGNFDTYSEAMREYEEEYESESSASPQTLYSGGDQHEKQSAG